jgi:hypothetical protein
LPENIPNLESTTIHKVAEEIVGDETGKLIIESDISRADLNPGPQSQQHFALYSGKSGVLLARMECRFSRLMIANVSLPCKSVHAVLALNIGTLCT